MLKTILNKWLLVDPVALVFEILSDGAIMNYAKNLNVEHFVEKSLDTNNKKLKYFNYTGYSEYYYKKQKGVKKTGVPFSIGDPYSVENSGEFVKSIIYSVRDYAIEIQSNPLKIDEETGAKTNLLDAFGSDLLGLNDENLQKIIDKVTPLLIREILQEVQGD